MLCAALWQDSFLRMYRTISNTPNFTNCVRTSSDHLPSHYFFPARKRKKKFWFHVGNILRTKLSEQAEPHPIHPPTINRQNQQDHFTLNRPLRYYYRPLLGQARGFGDAVARGFHLCVRLRSQNREFATTGGENNIPDSTKTPRRWQFFRCHQQKCPHATSEVLPLPNNKDARLSLKTP